MAAPKRTPKQMQDALDLVKQYGGVTQAAKASGIPRGTLHHCYKDAVAWAKERGEWNSRESFHNGRRKPKTSHECEAVLNDWLGRSTGVKRPKQDRKPGNTPDIKRIVIATDFHAPFHDPWTVSELITREAKQTDLLIIGGDFTDSYSFSKFIKTERVGAEQEWAACDALLSHLSEHFTEIVCIEGNHDMRLERHLRATLSPDVMFAIEQLTGGELDPFKAIAKKYRNVSFAGHRVGRFNVGWFAQFGDLLVTHAEKFSIVPGSALRTIDAWFTNQDLALGLKPWRYIVQAHTHQLGWFPWKADRLLVESGCMCEIHGYMLHPRMGGLAQRRGYVKLEQTNGVTDYNSVKPINLDADRPQESAA